MSLDRSAVGCDTKLKRVRFVTNERSMEQANGSTGTVVKASTQHACNSKAAFCNEEKTQPQQSDSVEETDEEEVYEVEAILSHRKVSSCPFPVVSSRYNTPVMWSSYPSWQISDYSVASLAG